MTNTIYFNNVNRDDISVSSSDVSSQQLSSVNQQQSASASSSSFSSLYSVIGKAFSALGFQRSGMHRRDENGYESSGVISSASMRLIESEDEILETPNLMTFILETPNLMTFSFKELKSATGNFRPVYLLGEGGSGKVFKGWVDEEKLTATKPGRGIAVAVKVLNASGFQGEKEWLSEIKYLGRLYHPNLVKLCGYCLDYQERLLVYEFVSGGSLDNHLFRWRGPSSSFLSWSLRMRIALGAAKGIAFLHRTDINVIHWDVRCSNILLDSDFNAKLSDFGLGRDGPTDVGSPVDTVWPFPALSGYEDPYYLSTGDLTPQSDVFSFGVVLLEILTGRRAIDKNLPLHEQILVEWAKPCLNNTKVSRIVDYHLHGWYSKKSCRMVAKLILKCVERDPKMRPNIVEVVTTLEQVQEI